MSNKMWSTLIQAPEELYRSRGVRFREDNRELFLKAMGLKERMRILEVGCGPGLLTHRLAQWLPGSRITGLDRDSNFVSFADKKSRELGLSCEYVQGDALDLPFPDNSFDACTSHTVIEHVPNLEFIKEQYRVCSKGGVVSVISSRTEAAINAENWMPISGEEEELWKRAEEASKECLKREGICKYPCSVNDIPKYMEKAGFKNVSVDFVAVTWAPDNENYPMGLRREFLESNRKVALDSVWLALNYAPDIWTREEFEKLRELINKRFDKRMNMLERGEKQWDIAASMLMVVKGYK